MLKNAQTPGRPLHALLGDGGRDEPDTDGLALKAFAALQRELLVKDMALRNRHCEQPAS